MPNPANPPVAIPAGQSVVYIGATTFTASGTGGGVAIASSTAGAGGLSFSNPLLQQSCQAHWSNYAIPSSLNNPSTVVHGIYPYMEYNGAIFSSNWSVFIDGTLIGGTGGTFNGSKFINIGTNLASIPAVTASFFGEATLPIGVINDGLNITWVGVAVYITTPPTPVVSVRLGLGTRKTIGFD